MTIEIYSIGETGRVKAAGVPFDVMEDPAQQFKACPTVASAAKMTNHYLYLRQSPSDEIRDRFFPRDDRNKALFRQGPLLTRPILKTDQGAGQFLSFEAGENGEGPLRYTVSAEQGYCIGEAYFMKQLAKAGNPPTVMEAMLEVERNFAGLDLREAQLAYERLQIACEASGIATNRQAQVGREALFFIRPAFPDKPVVLPEKVYSNVEKAVGQQIASFEDLGQEARRNFAYTQGMEVRAAHIYKPLYFQADVQVQADGSAVVDQIHLPDVGLFLTSLNASGNEALMRVQQSVTPLKSRVVDTIVYTIQNRHQNNSVYLITRPEVLEADEDILEIREMAVLTEELAERGISARPISADQALSLSPRDVGILMNVDVRSSAFTRLLINRLTDERTAIYPDPFLRLAAEKMTGYKRVELSVGNVQTLQALVCGVELGKPEQVLRSVLSLDNYLQRLGVADDVFHIYTSSQKTPIACYRYDVRGIQIALSYIKSGDLVSIRSIPIYEDNAVLFKQEKRPLYVVFRCMATKENI